MEVCWIIVYLVYYYGQPVCNDYLFKKSPCHSFQSGHCIFIAEIVFDMELRQEVFRPFDRSGYQLGKKVTKSAKMPRCFSGNPSLVNVYRITHRLKRVEGNTHRKQQLKSRNGIGYIQRRKQFPERVIEKIEVLESK